jgi:hypothetical protein
MNRELDKLEQELEQEAEQTQKSGLFIAWFVWK